MKMNSFVAAVAMMALLPPVGCGGTPQNNGTGTTPPPAKTSTCQSIADPEYVYPTPQGSNWNTAVADSPWNSHVSRFLIMDPENGPGTAASSDYQSIISVVHKAGGLVLGYVYTDYGYGDITLAEAEAQVNDYAKWYPGIDGIFVDCTSALASLVNPYYQPLVSYITAQMPNAKVFLNVGGYPDPSYAALTIPSGSSLTIVVFEDTYAAYQNAGGVTPAWAKSLPSSMFMDIVHDASAGELASALTISVQRNVGTVYITDQTLPDPYGILPSYWKDLVAETQAACPASSQTAHRVKSLGS